MKYKVNGRELLLNNAEVKSAKRVVASFLKNIDKLAAERHQPTYYFTALLVMHLMSQEALDNMDPDNLARIMNTLEHIRKAGQN